MVRCFAGCSLFAAACGFCGFVVFCWLDFLLGCLGFAFRVKVLVEFSFVVISVLAICYGFG